MRIELCDKSQMIWRLFIVGVLACLPVVIALPASAADIYHRKDVCHKDWVYGVMPFVGLCSISNFAWLHCFNKFSKEKQTKIAQSLDGMKTHNNKTELEFLYLPGKETYSVVLTSSKVSLDEGQYNIGFRFDGNPDYKIIGYVTKKVSDGIMNEMTYRNSIVFEHKKILRELVPKMKKHSRLEVSVNGTDKLPMVSLLGFSKAYQDMQVCMGKAVTYDLSDPF